MAAPRQVRRSTQAERWSLGNSRRSARLGSARLGSARLGSARLGSARLGSARLGSARLGSARLGSARLGSARLGSARLGSARLGSALIMRANGQSRFCQVFFRVIHNFFPWCRSDRVTARRLTPHGKNGLSGPTATATGRRPLGPLGPVDPARSSAWFSFVYDFAGWVCQGTVGGVFRRFTSSFQVGGEAIIGQKYFGGFFRSFTSNSASGKIIAVCSNNSVRIPGSSTRRTAGRGGERGLEPGPRAGAAESELPCRSSPGAVQRRGGNRHEEPGRL